MLRGNSTKIKTGKSTIIEIICTGIRIKAKGHKNISKAKPRGAFKIIIVNRDVSKRLKKTRKFEMAALSGGL
jgi:hypothetical protein